MGYKEFINILFSKAHLVIVRLENAYHINAKKFRYKIVNTV